MFHKKNLLTCKDLSKEQIYDLFVNTEHIATNPSDGRSQSIDCKDESIHFVNQNIILVNAFFEPSTRTSLSFECAVGRLGGKTISFNKDVSSLKKGESFEDTIRTLSTYGDILVVRHPEKGMVQKAAEVSTIPVINAGDGNGEHPTQALLDLYTMYQKWGEDLFTDNFNKKILFIGDIKNSRTIHSLLDLLKLFPTIETDFLPYEGLSLDDNTNSRSSLNSIDFSSFDVIYCTRLQKERESRDNLRVDFVVDNEFLKKLNDDCMIMHPLPRNNEINPEIDNDKRVYYFKQMENGVIVRKNLIKKILKVI